MKMGSFSGWGFTLIFGSLLLFLSFKDVTINSLMGQENKPDQIQPETISIGIVDAFYCQSSFYKSKYPNIEFIYLNEAKNSVEDCSPYEESKIYPDKLHGHLMVENILNGLNELKDKKFKIYLATVFNRVGLSFTPYWESSIEKLNRLQPNIIVMAVGYFKDEKLDHIKIKSPVFLASGNTGRGISETTKLYPHKNNAENFIMVGNAKAVQFNPNSLNSSSAKGHQFIFDPSVLHQKQIDFFGPNRGKLNNLQASSFATAYIANQILKKCEDLKSLEAIKTCLKREKRPITFKQSKIKQKSLKQDILTSGFTF